MPEEKRCSICGKLFTPSTYRPDQSVCSSSECQRKRQLNNMKQWRAEKAASSKDSSWKEACRRRSLEWHKKHQAYLKLYRQEHKEKHKEYMKEYMKRHRRQKKLAAGEANIDTGDKT